MALDLMNKAGINRKFEVQKHQLERCLNRPSL